MKRHLLACTILAGFAASSSALAQDVDVYYTTPTIQSGQPVLVPVSPQVRTVPVYTPVPVAVDGNSIPAPTPATAADEDYLGAPTVQTSQHDQSVTFVSGGIGSYEKNWFDQQSSSYALKVTYSDTTGHHLSGVDVTLADTKGATVLSATTEGPFLLVNAKPGTYTLTSTYQGTTKSGKVTLGKGLQRTVVTFADLNN